jgi:short-subunit dehydrogenase
MTHEDKKYLVLGSAGHLGKGIVKSLVQKGSNVLSVSSKSLPTEFNHRKLHHNLIDLSSNFEDFKSVLENFTNSVGPIDGIVHLASRGSRSIRQDSDSETFKNEFTEAPLLCWEILKYSKRFLNHEKSSIVVFGSMWGNLIPIPKMYLDLNNEPAISLPPSRAALHQLVKYLAVIWARDNIRCNLIIPGWFPKPGKTERLDYIEQITSRIPLDRIGLPEEIIGPTLFLLSNESSYMTGSELIVDGGYGIH